MLSRFSEGCSRGLRVMMIIYKAQSNLCLCFNDLLISNHAGKPEGQRNGGSASTDNVPWSDLNAILSQKIRPVVKR